MSVYLISYDLNAPGKDYSDLYTSIKSIGDYYHVLGSEWFVSSSYLSENDIGQKIHSCMDSTDSLFVCKVAKGYSGWLTDDAWAWLNNHL